MPIFGKRNRESSGGDPIRLYYASDIHGTEVLWKKFLNAPKVYKAQALVMGGDVTGKMVVPILDMGDGTMSARLHGRMEVATKEDEVRDLERRIRGNGMYPYRTSPDEVRTITAMTEPDRDRWFEQVMLRTFEQWLAMVPERLEGNGVRCFVMLGNDDPSSLEELIQRAPCVESCEENIQEIDGYSMISVGYSNRTPWDSPRELDEEELYRRIARLADQISDMDHCIFNLHVPPYDSRIDSAPQLDDDFNIVLIGKEPNMIPVGSTAVREAIMHYQPMLSMHGHIHESPGAVRLGRTLSINPGSEYHTGRLQGCLLYLRDGTVQHQFLTG
jgi:uncharacterized protein